MAPHPLALITGASAGMGAAFARAYAARGCDVALVARRAERLQALASELVAAHGIEALVIPCDLAAEGAETTVLEAVEDQGRHVDILVNNAGFSIPQSFAAVPWARQREFLMTLVVSACGLAHGAIPGMVSRGRGSIITLASLAGFAPGAAGHSLYPAAKSLAIKFTQSLDAEYRAKGLKVTAVCPGFVKTEFAEANGTQDLMDEAPRMFFLTPEAVAEGSIKANERGRVIYVPGLQNKIAALMLRYLPEPLVSAAVKAGSRKYHLD